MALSTTITPSNIAVALGVTAPDAGSAQFQQWEMWISDALMLVQVRATELSVADGDVEQARLDYVVREAVVRQVKRPDDATQVTVSVDDASTSRTYRSSTGRVDILDEWWSLLGLTPSGGGAFDIDGVSTSVTHLDWCSVNFGATYCSCGADIAGFPIYEGGWW